MALADTSTAALFIVTIRAGGDEDWFCLPVEPKPLVSSVAFDVRESAETFVSHQMKRMKLPRAAFLIRRYVPEVGGTEFN